MASASSTLLRFLGFDSDQVPDDAEPEISFANMPESWGVFVLLGVVAVLIWFSFRIYRREIPSCPLWGKHLLAFLRVATVLALVLIYLDPSVTYTKVRSLRPVISLLRDESGSMKTVDAYRDETNARATADALGKSVEDLRSSKPTRADVLNQVLQSPDHDFLQKVSDKGRLRLIDFAANTEEIDLTPPENTDEGDSQTSDPEAVAVLPPVTPAGHSTDLARALREGLSERLTSALIVTTDGQHNVQSDLEAVARTARNRGVPFYLLGLGDPTRPRNLQVSDVYADPQVWNNDPFVLQAVVRAQGLDGETVGVELVEQRPQEDGELEELVLEEKDVAIPAEGGQARVSFDITPESPGMKFYTVRAKALEDESNLEDNQPPPVQVKVLDDRARVLLVSGVPSWDYRALTRLLMREKMIDVSIWLQSLDEGRLQQGNTPIDRLPATKEALYEYDVVLLLDPDPREFDTAWIELLKQFVREHSGGVLYHPGPIFSGPFLTGTETGSLIDLLPVNLGDVGAMELDALLATNNQAWPLGVVAANVDQPIMRFFPEIDRTLEEWRRLPGVYWSFPALDSKPAARALLEHSDPTLRRQEVARPLLVTGQFGSGRTVFLGFEGTWRWRGFANEYYKRFWVQTTRYLVEGRALAGKRRGVLETERFRYLVGDRVLLSARLNEPDFEPMIAESVAGSLTIPGEAPVDVLFKPVENQPGQYQAILPAEKAGPHTVRIVLPGDANGEVTIDASYSVSLPIKEVQETWLDKPQLVELAKLSGGRYFAINEIKELLAALPNRVRRLETQSPPMALWDNRFFLILIALLLTVEWILRKRFKLL
ncbi:MAG: hypothetical protein AAF514_12665 [Verrucomicrobiota bacterium]